MQLLPQNSNQFVSTCDGVSSIPKTISFSGLDIDQPQLFEGGLGRGSLTDILNEKLLDVTPASASDYEDDDERSNKVDGNGEPKCKGCLSFSCPVCPYEEFFRNIQPPTQASTKKGKTIKKGNEQPKEKQTLQ